MRSPRAARRLLLRSSWRLVSPSARIDGLPCRQTCIGSGLLALAFIAAGCSGGKAARPVTKPGELVVVAKETKANGSYGDLALGRDGTLYVADYANRVVRIYPPGGGHRE